MGQLQGPAHLAHAEDIATAGPTSTGQAASKTPALSSSQPGSLSTRGVRKTVVLLTHNSGMRNKRDGMYGRISPR